MKTLDYVHHSSFFTNKYSVSSEFHMLGIVNAVSVLFHFNENNVQSIITETHTFFMLSILFLHFTSKSFYFVISQSVPMEALDGIVTLYVPPIIMDVCVYLSVSVTLQSAIT